eukprot:TRINITY_DN93417_c0_g1_i1.p1 TRINITY_DN93417_c0_g1~~TRINITY_DN93417_c0_g1_i1.p1  ORF type:complete len:305 (-),score=69.49 TRINITY_DN93417_c0_g1_i1:299-1213(-)
MPKPKFPAALLFYAIVILQHCALVLCRGSRRPMMPLDFVRRGLHFANCSRSVLARLDLDYFHCRQLKYFAGLTMTQAYNRIAAMTMASWHKGRLSYDAVVNANVAGIDGDVVEAGVWKGGMTALMMLSNLKADLSRHFWLYDTFDGMPPPDENDDAYSHQHWQDYKSGKRTVFVEDGKWCYGSLETVKRTVRSTAYPLEKIHFVQGMVEETLRKGQPKPQKIAVLRIDTDFYSSTKSILETLYDRVEPGGTLIVDDYFNFGGQRDAMRQFFEKRNQLEELDFNEKAMTDVFTAMLPNLIFYKSY